MMFKDETFWHLIKGRLLDSYNKWCYCGAIPDYINDSRIVSLSKEEYTQYPELGNIRTISILSVPMKMLELSLLQKLKAEIKRIGLIHPNQVGFESRHQCTEHVQTIV